MPSNFVNKQNKPEYRTGKKLPGDWNYIGDGKFNDPIIGHPAMRGRRWMIDYGYGSGKSFEKFQQGLKK
jgi:hypothetical protein